MAVLTTGRLPVRLTPLVGRDAELSAVTSALAGSRLLTLTGPGGTGKTRLALAAATETAARRDVAWVELAPVTDPDLVAHTVAGRLGVPETPGLDPAAALARQLAARSAGPPILLVLDNCEHQAAAVAGLTEHLLAECPALSVLATSREPLAVEGERAWPVPPLGDADAVRLFEDRARLVAPSFSITDANAGEIAGLCAKLDGLPLAIELAAARMRVLSVRQLAERLGDVFGVLTGGARSAPARHQTLRATLDWSHDLLTAEERTVFRRLAVFSGGFSLEAAERVTTFGGLDPGQGLDLLTRLADKSLIRVEHERYHLLATIREYAADLLAAAGELAEARRAHLAYYAEFAERTGPRVERAAAAELEAELDSLDLERANLRAAGEFARETGDAIAALRIAGQLGRYAYLRGHYHEIRQWMDLAVTAGRDAPPELRAKALYGSGRLAHLQCDYEPAVRRLDAALLLYRSLGDTAGIASCLQALGSVAREQGRYARSAQLHAEGLELARTAGDAWAEASARSYLGFVSWLQGDFGRAIAECSAALTVFRSLGDVEGTAWSLLSLGVVARYQGDLQRSGALLRESLELSESIGFREGIAWCQEQLGLLALAGGAAAEAEAQLRLSFAAHRELRDRWRMASVLEGLAATELAGRASHATRAARAARLLGTAQAMREAIGTVLAPCERSQHDRSAGAAKTVLGDAAFEAAWQQGLRPRDPNAALDEPASAGETAAPVPDAGAAQGQPAPAAQPGPAAPQPAPATAPAARSPAASRRRRRPAVDVPAQATPAARAGGQLAVRALGTATVELDGVLLTAADWGYAKPRELLFLLATSPPLTREQLGAALWPELSRQQLGNALHTALRELRRALGDPEWVVYSGGRYSFNRMRRADCDVDTFEAALAAANRARPPAAALPDLQRAIAAYGGDFLAGMSAGDWAQARRGELRRRYETALFASGRLHAVAGRHAAAVTAFRRAIEHEPLNESAHRELMVCWEQLGETARAVRHYEELAALLRDEVGVPPAAETTALYQRLAGLA